MSELNRREFVIAAACAAGACLMCGGAGIAEAAEAAAADAGANKVDIGTAADYPKDGAYDKLADTKRVIVVRDGSKIYALTAICPHQRGLVVLKNGVLDCQKHHTKFEASGKAKPGGR